MKGVYQRNVHKCVANILGDLMAFILVVNMEVLEGNCRCFVRSYQSRHTWKHMALLHYHNQSVYLLFTSFDTHVPCIS